MKNLFLQSKHRTLGEKMFSWFLAFSVAFNWGYAPLAALVAYASEPDLPAMTYTVSTAEADIPTASFGAVDSAVDNAPASTSEIGRNEGVQGQSVDEGDGHNRQSGSEVGDLIELIRGMDTSSSVEDAAVGSVASGTSELQRLAWFASALNMPGADIEAGSPYFAAHKAKEDSGIFERGRALAKDVGKKVVRVFVPTAYATGSGSPVSVVATKIVCDKESDLPNWGAYGHVVTANTATDYVAAHPSCRLQSGWKFQWGFIKPDHSYGVMPLPGNFVGEADGSAGAGTNTGTGFADWKTFGPTNSSGKVTITIDLPNNQTAVKFREVLQSGYIPFSDDVSNNVTAEIKCGDDNWGYANYNWIGVPTPGKTYYCVAWNVPKTTPPANNVKIIASKVVCDKESDLPNWGPGGGSAITSTTAADYVATHPSCHLEDGWRFQWGYGDKSGAEGVDDPGRDFIGEATTGTTYGTWKSFGPTDANGKATVEIANTAGAPLIWVREALQNGYIPFTFDQTHQSNADNVSAELYCNTDVYNYDNYDQVENPQYGQTYYCVAWNVPKVPPTQCTDGIDNDGDGKIDYPSDPGCSTPEDNDENQPPLITLLGANPMTVIVGSTWSDPGATAQDPEDGNITPNIVKTGTVNTNVVGSYTISYNVVDSKGLAATPKVRTVNVVPAPKQCSDGIDNDGDGMIDFPVDTGCSTPDDNDENNPPVITVLGANPTQVTMGTTWSDPGATASDPEDGNITANIVKTGTVNTNVLGTYVITYNVADSKGLAATPKTRTVYVVAACSDGIDNDVPADGMIDFPVDPGCSSPNDNDENTRPVITVVGANPMNIPEGSIWSDPGATANDAEDGNITGSIATTGTVNTLVPGAYAVTYNVSDSKGLAAVPQTRIVNVIAVPKKQCSDGIDNDGDGKIDFPADTGCTSTDDDDENNPPQITVLGANPLVVTLGSAFTDPGATALDPEDGSVPVTASGVVNSGAIGTYTVTYTAQDSKGLAATPKTRTVIVAAACSDGKDNDTPADGMIDFPADTGCSTPDDNDENDPPVITVVGANPLEITVGGTFTDPGATAQDPEDGDRTSFIVVTGVVNTGTVGTYTLTYNVSDSKGLAATPKTRTVKVNPPLTQCNDTIDNDGDNTIDWNGAIKEGDMAYPPDAGCTGPDDDDENQPPVITVIGANPMVVTLGDTFTDPGATALDPEEGNVTVTASGVVNSGAIGTYTITYAAQDSKGLAATPKTRTVNVVAACSDGKDNDGDGKIDIGSDTGCSTPDDNDENNPPVITVIGADPLIFTVGDVFIDPGATALDPEDGNITGNIATTSTVNMSTPGTYTVTYNVSDSKGLAAVPATRTVIVNPLPPVNQPPVITVIGANPMVVTVGSTFTDPGATALDPEDGAVGVTATGTVNTATLGAYTITYNAVDSKGLAATPKTRTVNVAAACSDGIDNDTPADGKFDFPNDPGCSTPEDNDENEPPTITLVGANPMTVAQNSTWTDPGATAFDPEELDITSRIQKSGTVNTSATGTYVVLYTVSDTPGLTASTTRTVNVVSGNQPPVITLIGDNPMTITVGSTFTDPGATAADLEDGNITSSILTTGTVNTGSIGTYTVVYNVIDSKGLAATPATRTVNVVSGGCTQNCGGGTPPICANGADDDGDGLADYPRDPGCDSSTDNDETNTGGGGGPTPLTIYNEKLTIVDNSTVTITWNTNLNADSRVVYGTTAVTSLGAQPLYGYAATNATDTTATVNHSMTIAGLATTETYYFRPVSNDNRTPVIGIELQRGEILGASLPEACFYLRTYLRLGYNNDPDEVRKLQTFLRDEEGFTNLAVTGFFDRSTDKAVRVFQERYRPDVLDPWGLPSDTGYVYYTTQKKVNEIHCKRMFPLNDDQLREIRDYFDRLHAIVGADGRSAKLPAFVPSPFFGTVAEAAEVSPEDGAAVEEGEAEIVAPVSVVPATETKEPKAQGTPPGKIALRDLLATVPSVGMDNEPKTDGEVAGADTVKSRGLAGVALAISERTGLTVGTVYTVLFFSLLVFVLALIAVGVCSSKRKEEEIQVPEGEKEKENLKI